MLCALAVSGCSYKLASLVSTDENEPQSTGTINSPTSASFDTLSTSSPQTELDLAYARAAVAEVLSRGGKDASVLNNALAAFHAGRATATLDELHARYRDLVLRIIALLEQSDASLAHDLTAASDHLWATLADPGQFASLTKS